MNSHPSDMNFFPAAGASDCTAAINNANFIIQLIL
jgi:hypothetical protein